MKSLKHIGVVFCFVWLAATLAACKSASVVPPTTIETTITKTVKEVIRDTVFQTKKDSSFYKAYLDCENGKVVIKNPTNKKGEYLKPPKVNIVDNILTVDCEAEAQKMFAQWKDIYTQENNNRVEKIPFAIDRELTSWQTVRMWLGNIFLIILLGLIGLGLFTKFKK